MQPNHPSALSLAMVTWGYSDSLKTTPHAYTLFTEQASVMFHQTFLPDQRYIHLTSLSIPCCQNNFKRQAFFGVHAVQVIVRA